MTKKLEELFDLPKADQIDITKEENSLITDIIENENDVDAILQDTPRSTLPEMQTALEKIDKIDAALPSVNDLQTSDNEMDEIADMAKDTFKDLMDLGMNVDSRFSGEIFTNASRMLDTALSAKSAKINKKLRMVDLQIKKATLDARLAKEARANGEDIVDGQGETVDRNQLLNEILGRNIDPKE
jgi:hypothetical protein